MITDRHSLTSNDLLHRFLDILDCLDEDLYIGPRELVHP